MTRDPQYEGAVHAPEFPEGLYWLNTAGPLSLKQLSGKIVLLDFWSYCCINCLHVLPELAALEQKYAAELVVIGVHSGKFTAEKDPTAIRSAISRYEITHPVVNDPDYVIWNAYGVRAWPSFMLINPNGRIIGTHSGEGTYKLFDTMISRTAEYFDRQNILDRSPLESRPEQSDTLELRYPGKVTCDDTDQALYVSDTGHNRIVVTDLDGRIRTTIGSGSRGLRDGGFSDCTFHSPQGVSRSGSYLYVCDTGNHAIRVADLEGQVVTTLFGTGEQARMPNVAGNSTDVRLNSPWDISAVGDHLFVAMAGAHQIWMLNTTSLSAAPYAGSGREGLEDGSLMQAVMAQPSGITVGERVVYVADCEASAIRSIDLATEGYVRTLVGKGLFKFGDQDGLLEDASLQHALGIEYYDGNLYIADTYNARIKELNLASQSISSIAGTGMPGFADGPLEQARFSEPSGLSLLDGRIYVADTNNHCIRIVDQESKTVSTLSVE